jgi:adenosylcobyric acid synthase
MASIIMLQGTSSHVGKSILTAALCRIFKEDGHNVAPFKAQNMALNSFVTKEGLEIGMAQAFQAEAAGIEPIVHINPILLKPTKDTGSQVIIHGRPYRDMEASEYHKFKKVAARYVNESFNRLCELYNIIIIEGAGSPAEVNLRDGDIANMGLAEMIDAPVLLVGDIDRGGVFAFLIGTLELLNPVERTRVKGFIINKFRGDIELLRPGLEFLEKRTGLPVIGVVPYLKDIRLPDEDGLALTDRGWRSGYKESKGCSRPYIGISVIKLPHISNFTDFDPFVFESDLRIQYAEAPGDLEGADLVIIPGSKNTIHDLVWLKERGIAEVIIDHAKGGGRVIGICGGFQMLGGVIRDHCGIESSIKEIKGLGLLDVETVMEKEKRLSQVEAVVEGGVIDNNSYRIYGYEIHMGSTVCGGKNFSVMVWREGTTAEIDDGAVSDEGNVWGTYIHGIFNNDDFRTAVLNEIRSLRGLPLQELVCFNKKRDEGIIELARVVRDNIDMRRIYDIAGVIERVPQI